AGTTFTISSIWDAYSPGTSSGSATVTVSPRPATPSITAPASVVASQSFTAAVASEQGFTWSWTVVNGAVTAGAGTSTVTIEAGTSGPVTIAVITVDSASGCASDEAFVSIPMTIPATRFYPVSPCRLFDTRESAGPSAGSPSLSAGETRTFTIGSRCGLDTVTARSISVNQTVADAATDGELVLYRGDLDAPPPSSSISFRAGRTRANNGILELSRTGDGSFKVTNRSAGSVHLILDVNGVFR
uniref:hypothetical protein n=1 Tax=Microbacterium sp. TaxID=51671 RepID=UPI003221B239